MEIAQPSNHRLAYVDFYLYLYFQAAEKGFVRYKVCLTEIFAPFPETSTVQHLIQRFRTYFLNLMTRDGIV